MKLIKNYKRILLIVLVLSLAVFIVSASALSLAYRTPSYIRKNINTKILEARAVINYSYHIKPSILFDNKTEIRSNSIYMTLAKGLSYNITINYKYREDPNYGVPTNVSINAAKIVEITTSSWRKTIINENMPTTNNTFADNGYVSFDKYTAFVKNVNNQIGLHPIGYTIMIKYKILFTINYDYAYQVYSFIPTITIHYDELNRVIATRIDNTTLDVSRDSATYIPTNTTIFGLTFNTGWLREKTFYTALVSAAVMLSSLGAVAYYTINDNSGYRAGKVLQKYKSRIFKGKFVGGNKEVVKVEDINDIVRASELYGEIIIYDPEKNWLVVNARSNTIVYEDEELDKIL